MTESAGRRTNRPDGAARLYKLFFPILIVTRRIAVATVFDQHNSILRFEIIDDPTICQHPPHSQYPRKHQVKCQLPRQPTMDPEMNKLLKWSVTNSQASVGAEGEGSAPNASEAAKTMTPEMLSRLFGGPSDADLMRAAIEVVNDPETDLENKLIAFDNFEQLIEGIDNANNLEPMGLWTPLVQLLKHEETEIRRYAAWSIGTAVQNNPKAQDKVYSL